MSKKILIIANTDWYLYNFRLDLIKKLKSVGFDPVMVSPSGAYSEKFTELGFRHINWDVGRQSFWPWEEIKSIRQIKKIYKLEKPALVHHHTNKAVLYGTLAARGLEIPILNSIPGRGFVFSSNTFLARILRPIVVFLYRLAFWGINNQMLIFENRSDMKAFIQKKFIIEDLAVLIPSVGVNISKFPKAPVPEGPITVAFVGRLLQDKGVGVFADAAKLLKERGQNIRMVIIGNIDPGNPDSYTENEVTEWVNSGSVEWWGWQENMASAYSRTHILAYPTNYGEGVPTTLIEAGACERAVIASDWPGCRELITHNENGILVPPKNADALAEAIERLAANRSEYDRMRKSLHKLVLEKFTAEQINSQTSSIYASLIQ